MATNWPSGVDTPHDPVPGESQAQGSPGDLAKEISDLNDRTVAMQHTVLPIASLAVAGVDVTGGLASFNSVLSSVSALQAMIVAASDTF